MKLFGNNKKILILIITVVLNITYNIAHSLENKIEFKINNEIITTYDIVSEINYLKAFNKNFRDLDKKKILEISKNSLINQKIKKLEILKFVKEINTNKDYVNRLIQATHKKMGINTYDAFLEYLTSYNLDDGAIRKRISQDILWKRLVFSKYSKKIKINKNKLEEKITKSLNNKIKSYLLSEILFLAESKDELDIKAKSIKESILEIGFENTVLAYSISESSKEAGNIGWISENSLNNKIKLNLNKINIGEITEPIIMPGSFLILKIKNIKLESKKIDKDNELKRLFEIEKNKQLKQYSNIYYNKIKKDYIIDEL